MREIMLLGFFLCCIGVSNAQESNEYTAIDNLLLKIPDSQANSTDDIARYVRSHFDTDRNKVRAIYAWVTTNIRYDKDSASLINTDIAPEARITVALRRRKGVCENFAAIFNDICLKAGLTSFVVSGYTKQSGAVDKTGHSWCAVLINDNWYLFDPTWDQGSIVDSKYFLIEPLEFLQSHMPFDPLWQLINYPVSHQQFYSGNIYTKNDTPYFNYVDSVAAYIRMDSLHRFQSTALRIQRQGLYNSRVKDNYNYVKMHIEMINQDKDVELYNSSLAGLNKATTILNSFIEYRNQQFIPEKTDAELQVMLDGIENELDSSLKKLDELDKSKATLTLNTEPVRSRIIALLQKIRDQQKFIKQYLNTDKTARKSLFY